jgi:hypothetical protein
MPISWELYATRQRFGPAMPTPNEFRKNAEDFLKLARETTEIYARMALIEMATEFRVMAEHLERAAARRTADKLGDAWLRFGVLGEPLAQTPGGLHCSACLVGSRSFSGPKRPQATWKTLNSALCPATTRETGIGKLLRTAMRLLHGALLTPSPLRANRRMKRHEKQN